MKKQSKSGNPIALLPILVFITLFLGVGISTKDFSKMPILVAFFLASIVAFMLNCTQPFSEKVKIFCNGAGQADIMMMFLIFILAGTFSSVVQVIGGVDALIQLSLNFIPSQFLLGGLFLIACFVSLSMGTSIGTITALAPIGLGIAETTSMSIPLVISTIIGGSMFGDNLSMISDTTFTAARTQGCELRDKFKTNFIIVLPAAVITIIILNIISAGYTTTLPVHESFDLIKILPYIFVLIGSLLGVNVFILLTCGTIFAGIIGISSGTINIFQILEAISNGINGMTQIIILLMIIGGTFSLIQHQGGITYLLSFIKNRIHTKKGATFGIAALVSIIDLCTASNTISIMIAGPLAKDIAKEYDIDPKISASLLDIFSATIQGLLPYGSHLLLASSLSNISSMEFLHYLYYPMLMGVFGILSIIFGFPKLKNK
ncbi:MAG: Na+/H+ antiporter NhaC family protein [Cellulosilyticaceae bacterium]